ncbi:hypothetical protein [Sinorhizobium meliloti]|uniref:hypothetical protein n=1 Tax=Rhizobium meliloti TaxID=382 RepID=UPI0003049353|nr:hypothetical protein [Sinorhizobium meliloti]
MQDEFGLDAGRPAIQLTAIAPSQRLCVDSKQPADHGLRHSFAGRDLDEAALLFGGNMWWPSGRV